MEVCSLGKRGSLLGLEQMVERTLGLGWMLCPLEGVKC